MVDGAASQQVACDLVEATIEFRLLYSKAKEGGELLFLELVGSQNLTRGEETLVKAGLLILGVLDLWRVRETVLGSAFHGCK